MEHLDSDASKEIYKVEAESLGIKNDEVNEIFVKTLASYPNIKIPVINYLKNWITNQICQS